MNGTWTFERSSGYAGYRCTTCSTWVYANDFLICSCMTRDDVIFLKFGKCFTNPRFKVTVSIFKSLLKKGSLRASTDTMVLFVNELVQYGFIFPRKFTEYVQSGQYDYALEMLKEAEETDA